MAECKRIRGGQAQMHVRTVDVGPSRGGDGTPLTVDVVVTGWVDRYSDGTVRLVEVRLFGFEGENCEGRKLLVPPACLITDSPYPELYPIENEDS